MMACDQCTGNERVRRVEMCRIKKVIDHLEDTLACARTDVIRSKIGVRDSRMAVLQDKEAEERPWLAAGSKPSVEVAEAAVSRAEEAMLKVVEQLTRVYKKQYDLQQAYLAYACCMHRQL